MPVLDHLSSDDSIWTPTGSSEVSPRSLSDSPRKYFLFSSFGHSRTSSFSRRASLLKFEVCRSISRENSAQHLEKESREIADLLDVQIESLIGRGGISDVYSAIWHGKRVAIKQLPLKSQKSIDDFKREIEILSQLSHVNIIKFLSASTIPPAGFIIQEFAKQGSLYDMLHAFHVRPQYGLLLRILIDIASAMDYCHSLPHPVIHRDLKTKNVLIGEDGRVLVSDFGTARLKPSSYVLTNHPAAGTVAYSAPEIFIDGKIDERTDVYSFGIIAWECLTGEIPWKSLLPMQVVMAVAVEMKQLYVPEECHCDLRSLIARCLDHDPNGRPTFAEIKRQLQEFQAL